MSYEEVWGLLSIALALDDGWQRGVDFYFPMHSPWRPIDSLLTCPESGPPVQVMPETLSLINCR